MKLTPLLALHAGRYCLIGGCASRCTSLRSAVGRAVEHRARRANHRIPRRPGTPIPWQALTGRRPLAPSATIHESFQAPPPTFHGDQRQAARATDRQVPGHEAHACNREARSRQGGAVLVLVGISLAVLIGFLGIVIDLGRLFVTKTELQTAMDACALAASAELRPSLYSTGLRGEHGQSAPGSPLDAQPRRLSVRDRPA